MVIGGYSPARDAFAERLADIADIPLVDTVRYASDLNPDSTPHAGSLLASKAAENDWVMVGNGFDHDKTARIERANVLFNFEFPSRQIFRHHIELTRCRRTLSASSLGERPKYQFLAAYYFIYKVLPEAQQLAVANARENGLYIQTFTSPRESADFMRDFVKGHN